LNKVLLFLLILAVAVAVTLELRYGEGAPYPDLTGPPLLDAATLEVELSYPEPVGNVAVSGDGRVFFTVHPESRPRGNRLLEWVDGAAEPYPDRAVQLELFDTVLGLHIDGSNRLWTIDHGNHGFRDARVLAIDLDSGEVVHDHKFAAQVAPAGSMLQDLRVSSDGEWVFVADASIWRQQPALVVYNTRSRQARRVLQSHPSVMAEDYLIRTSTRDMRYFGGLISLKAGVDGIELDAGGEWLYYGAINQSGLYRVPVRALVDARLPYDQVAGQVERVGDKPMSDGLVADAAGNVYITDVEHGAVHVARADAGGRIATLIRSPDIRWADSLALGPGNQLYIADSAIPDLVLQTREHVREAGPYFVYRVRLPTESAAD
jgi:sugar lactone lactonase YvrE